MMHIIQNYFCVQTFGKLLLHFSVFSMLICEEKKRVGLLKGNSVCVENHLQILCLDKLLEI